MCQGWMEDIYLHEIFFWTSSRNTFIPSFYVCLQDNKYLFTASKLLYSAIFTAYQNISIMQFPRIKNEYTQILHN